MSRWIDKKQEKKILDQTYDKGIAQDNRIYKPILLNIIAPIYKTTERYADSLPDIVSQEKNLEKILLNSAASKELISKILWSGRAKNSVKNKKFYKSGYG